MPQPTPCSYPWTQHAHAVACTSPAGHLVLGALELHPSHYQFPPLTLFHYRFIVSPPSSVFWLLGLYQLLLIHTQFMIIKDVGAILFALFWFTNLLCHVEYHPFMCSSYMIWFVYNLLCLTLNKNAGPRPWYLSLTRLQNSLCRHRQEVQEPSDSIHLLFVCWFNRSTWKALGIALQTCSCRFIL